MIRGKTSVVLMPASIENHRSENGQLYYFVTATSNGIDKVRTWAPEDLLKINYSDMIEDYWKNSRRYSHVATNTIDLQAKPSQSSTPISTPRVVYKVVNPPVVKNGKISYGAIPAQIFSYNTEKQVFVVRFADDHNMYEVGRQEMIATNPRMVCKFFLHMEQN